MKHVMRKPVYGIKDGGGDYIFGVCVQQTLTLAIVFGPRALNDITHVITLYCAENFSNIPKYLTLSIDLLLKMHMFQGISVSQV